MIHPATKFQFGRTVQDYARWRGVAEGDRSPAPAWWWGPALTLRDETDAMPDDWSHTFALPTGATYADAARLLLDTMAGQNSLPWPEEFPRRYGASRPVDH